MMNEMIQEETKQLRKTDRKMNKEKLNGIKRTINTKDT